MSAGSQPPGVSLDAWNDKVETCVDIQSVPGMGQFDIDGLDPGDQVTQNPTALKSLTFYELASRVLRRRVCAPAYICWALARTSAITFMT